jgi:hypothetical protein
MKKSGGVKLILTAMLAVGLFGCGSNEMPVEDILAKPKAYVGSENGKLQSLPPGALRLLEDDPS